MERSCTAKRTCQFAGLASVLLLLVVAVGRFSGVASAVQPPAQLPTPTYAYDLREATSSRVVAVSMDGPLVESVPTGWTVEWLGRLARLGVSLFSC